MRKVFFWFHLIIGCSAAIFIFLMSITGVGLTYERQMIQSAERADHPTAPSENAQPLPLDDMLALARDYPAKKGISIVLAVQENAPLVVKDGRKTLAYLDPYTGEELSVVPGESTKAFLSKLRAFHRWLTFDGSFSETGRWVNGISNVIFMLLLLSGLYLWLPTKFNKRAFKQKLVLTNGHKNTQARDYQWHNVFSIYMAPILFVVIFTAFFFSFKWPGAVLKESVSTTAQSLPKGHALKRDEIALHLPYQQLVASVVKDTPDWQRVSFSLNKVPMNSQVFQIDTGNGGEPQKRASVAVNTLNAEIIATQGFSDMSDYRKARSYIRFLHTGEVFGLTGQTLAGIASLLACLLVYTGVMMSWRRWQRSRARAK